MSESPPEWEELMGRDIMIRRVSAGEGGMADMGTVVVCDLEGYFLEKEAQGAEGSWVAAVAPFEALERQRYKVGESDAVPGLELALRHSRCGERLRVRFSSRFGYGPDGRPALEDSGGNRGGSGSVSVPAVPADVSLEYVISVLAHVPDGALDVELLRAACGSESNSSSSSGSSSGGLQAVARELALTVAEAEAQGEIGGTEADTEPEIEPETGTGTKARGGEGAGVGAEADRQRRVERLGALSELLQRKEAGNRWFQYQDFARAARAYSKGTQVADRYFNGAAQTQGGGEAEAGAGAAGGANQAAVRGMLDAQQRGADPDEARAVAEQQIAAAEAETQRRAAQPIAGAEAEVLAAYVQCLNNMAACQLRIGDPAKAKDICVRVLEIDPGNHKALLRAAKAALATHCFDECDVCLQRLKAVAPEGSSAAAAAHAVRIKLKTAQQQYREQQRQMGANIQKKLGGGNGGGGNSRTQIDASTEMPSAGPIPALTSTSTSATAPSSSGSSRSVGGVSQNIAPAISTATSAPTPAARSVVTSDAQLLMLLVTSVLVLLVSVVVVIIANRNRSQATGGS